MPYKFTCDFLTFSSGQERSKLFLRSCLDHQVHRCKNSFNIRWEAMWHQKKLYLKHAIIVTYQKEVLSKKKIPLCRHYLILSIFKPLVISSIIISYNKYQKKPLCIIYYVVFGENTIQSEFTLKLPISVTIICHDNMYFSSVQFSHTVVSDYLQPHGLQHTKLPCPWPTPRAYSNSCPSS